VALAQAAQKGWRRSSFADRRRLMRSLRAWVTADVDAISRVGMRDTGKTGSSSHDTPFPFPFSCRP
jgi:acyl-CoA reductase-like NAD-dependent aldehyde dehydrogenase